MRTRFLCLIIATVFMGVLAGTARAEIFTAYLTPAQEVPPSGTSANGYARLFINESTGSMNFIVFFQNLSSNQTGAHIHAPAAIGANVGVAVNLGTIGGTIGTISGTTTITPTQLAQLRQGLGYVNVHSGNFLNGEIRGQLQKQRPVDYDGDGRTDFSVLKFPDIAPPGVSGIDWWTYSLTSGQLPVVIDFGDANTDFPAPGDYDGDAKNDIAVYRAGATAGASSIYVILRSSDNTVQWTLWGLNGDETIQRDYDGDGITDLAVFRYGVTSTAPTTWFIRNSTTGAMRTEVFGLSGTGTTSADFPVPGDYDGDGKFDIAVYRFGQTPANNYIIKRSSDSVVTYTPFGNFNTDYVVPGDYDGDGKYDLAVARTGATGTSPLVWWILQSSNGATRTNVWGRSADFPAQGDYDGDGRTDLAIWRQGTTLTAQSFYWVANSFDNTSLQLAWGQGADFSVNTFDIR